MIPAGVIPADGRDHHVVAFFEGTRLLAIYVDGKPAALRQTR